MCESYLWHTFSDSHARGHYSDTATYACTAGAQEKMALVVVAHG
ncbi:hypothetical protein FHU34_11444 [Micromonospora taraxaci]|uniref:Uncharacterized protein n=1 Tax=Micromonospora taraxaci TaxID=1316803 RepID=A0A561VU40_9ACTN|nr:hypothetical protein FHU34_11444 [Micromonospora taraxaci]